MNFDFLGTTINEFDVVITDLILFIESLFFAYLFWRQKASNLLLKKLFAILFLSLAASSVFGAIFHAFFPEKVATQSGFILWLLVTAAIGAAASSIWCINAVVLKGRSLFRIVFPFSIVYFFALIYSVAFISTDFITTVLFYVPPMIILAVISLIKFLHERIYIWACLLMGIILSFIAAGTQYLRIGLDSVYFNYNATYHLIQGIALIFLFIAFRSILKNEKI